MGKREEDERLARWRRERAPEPSGAAPPIEKRGSLVGMVAGTAALLGAGGVAGAAAAPFGVYCLWAGAGAAAGMAASWGARAAGARRAGGAAFGEAWVAQARLFGARVEFVASGMAALGARGLGAAIRLAGPAGMGARSWLQERSEALLDLGAERDRRAGVRFAKAMGEAESWRLVCARARMLDAGGAARAFIACPFDPRWRVPLASPMGFETALPGERRPFAEALLAVREELVARGWPYGDEDADAIERAAGLARAMGSAMELGDALAEVRVDGAKNSKAAPPQARPRGWQASFARQERKSSAQPAAATSGEGATPSRAVRPAESESARQSAQKSPARARRL
jgi:hypothetical protein